MHTELHFNRINDVLYHDDSVKIKFGKVSRYEIKSWSCTFDAFGTKWLNYQLYVYGDKGNDWILLLMVKKPDQTKFTYTIE